MPELSITELVELVRAGLDDDQRIALSAQGAAAERGIKADASWHRSYGRGIYNGTGICIAVGSDGFLDPAIGEQIARHDPARVLAEVAAKRTLLDEALAWEHYEVDDPWYSCSAAPNAPSEHRTHGCGCGRDERVLAVLQLLATPYQTTETT